MVKKIFIVISFLIFFVSLSVLGAFFWFLNNHSVDFSILENYNPGNPSILLDDEGKEWGRFELDKREAIKLEKIPNYVIRAFLAAEDKDFFRHYGISFTGILRSIFVNIKNRRVVQGASTITQQLVKLLFFDSKRTFRRKVKEQFLSLIIERQFTKEQILEIYLNHIYFGCGIYGIAAACQRFFGKSVCEISISEAALLAGIQKCPALYCPLLNKKASVKRRDIVLNLMNKSGLISDEDLINYKNEELNLADYDKNSVAPYLKESIRLFLENFVNKNILYTGGLKIQTTLNQKLQIISQQKFTSQFKKLKTELASDVDGALVSIDSKSGEIKALIGGFDFSKSQFNRAIQAKRQLGSIIKPFIYASAIERGYNFAMTDIDEPIDIKFGNSVWQPNNYNNKFEGLMTLAKALSVSNNIVTIKTFLNIGALPIIDILHKAGINDEIQPYPSLSLGCIDISLIDAVAAFNIFANNGVYVKPYFIRWVKDEFGKKIWTNQTFQRNVLDPRVVGQVSKVLGIGIERYIKRTNSNLDYEAIGKTGTTNDSRTCWFCGSSPELTTGLYIGKDDNSSLGKNIYPVKTVFPIWMQIYSNLNVQDKKFIYDPALKEVIIDWQTGEFLSSIDLPNGVKILK